MPVKAAQSNISRLQGAITAYANGIQLNLDKSDEVELLDAFRSIVPRSSYLTDYLEGSVPHFENLIRSDMCEPMYRTMNAVRDEIAADRETLKAVKKELHDAQEKVKAAQREVACAARQVQDMAKQAGGMIDSIRAIERTAQQLNKVG